MDRTLLWQSIAITAICVGFAYKNFDLTGRGSWRAIMLWCILVGFVLGTTLVINYVFSQIHA